MSYGQDTQDVLHPGIKITSKDVPGSGTLGCFARLVSDPTKIAVLSNSHVLYGKSAGKGTKLGQPSVSCCCCRVIGNNLKNAFNKVAVTVTSAQDPDHVGQWEGSEVDCAIALLNDKRSYTNKTFYGMITGTPSAGLGVVGGASVKMVGTETGPSSGKVLKFTTKATYQQGGDVPDVLLPIAQTDTNLVAAGVPDPIINQMFILPDPDRDDPSLPMDFCTFGDSGAVILNAAHEVVGILNFAFNLEPPARDFLNKQLPQNAQLPAYASSLGVASPIGPVLAALGIKIDGNMSGTAPSAGDTVEELTRAQREREDELAVQETLRQLEEEVQSKRLGAEALAAIERHRVEVLDLLRMQRRVILAWHHNHGPAFAAHCLHSVRDPEYIVPEAIDGVTPLMLLERMAAVLRRYGSVELIADIDAYVALVYDWIDGCTSIWQLVKRMRRLEPIPSGDIPSQASAA